MNQLKTARFITQIAGWILFFSLPLVFMYNQHHHKGAAAVALTPTYWLFCITFLLLFYLLSKLLIPQLYLKKRYVAYFLVVFLLFAGVYLLKPFDRLMSAQQSMRMPENIRRPPDFGKGDGRYPGPPPTGEKRPDGGRGRGGKGLMVFDIVSVFLFIMIVALTMAIEINKQLYLTQKKAIKAEADKAEAELSFLKAQINPHFLYNTLNNIYTLAVTSSPNTAESIMKLSNIMRYITDDITDEFVLLQDELDCIADFIGLQELRLGAKNPISYVVHGQPAHKKIAPLILMTFVENAFKYGISKQKKSPVNIEIVLKDNELHFYAQNKNFAKQADKNSTGIGIQNTRQRLQHLYPGRHELNIEAGVEWFMVNLKLELA